MLAKNKLSSSLNSKGFKIVGDQEGSDIDDNEEFDADDESGESEENEESEEEEAKEPKILTTVEGTKFEIIEAPKVKERTDGVTFEVSSDDNMELEVSSMSGEEEDEDAYDPNPHGFLEGSHLDTFRRSKIEMKAERLIKKMGELSGREKRKHQRKEKKGGLSNKEKAKGKPMQMVKPKKIKKLQQGYRSMKERMKEFKTKLGKIREGKLRVHRKRMKTS